jgi:soluble lytic murein transglycosylase-like protein
MTRPPDIIDRAFRKMPGPVVGALLAVLLVLLLSLAVLLPAHAADLCLQYRSMLVREAQAVHGPDAPVPMFLGQLRQESSCRANITAGDSGRGLAQFMDATSRQVASKFPEIGPPAPYDPRWAIRAMVRYDGWIYRRVKGADVCNRWGAALKGYNAGPGYVLQAQAKSTQPGVWFGATEFVQTRQSPENFEYSRTYPRKIIFQHQLRYVEIGTPVCLQEPRS